MEEMNKDKTPILAGVFEGHIWGERPSMGYGIFLPDGICPAIPARIGGYGIVIAERTDTERKKIGNIYGFKGGNYAGNVYDENHICPAISTMSGGGQQPMVIDIEETKCIGGLSKSKWGEQFHQQDRVYKGDIALAHPANIPGGSYNYVVETDRYRIRKLTPKECWRLMGYTDADFDKAAKVNSNTQLYRQAGNAIVKQVLMAIFSQLSIQNITPWNGRGETI